MEKIAKKVLGVVPGFAMAAVIAVVARFLLFGRLNFKLF